MIKTGIVEVLGFILEINFLFQIAVLVIAVLNIVTSSQEFSLRNGFSMELSVNIVHKLRQLRNIDAGQDEGCFGVASPEFSPPDAPGLEDCPVNHHTSIV